MILYNTYDFACRGISLGRALSVDKLIEKRAPHFDDGYESHSVILRYLEQYVLL